MKFNRFPCMQEIYSCLSIHGLGLVSIILFLDSITNGWRGVSEELAKKLIAHQRAGYVFWKMKKHCISR